LDIWSNSFEEVLFSSFAHFFSGSLIFFIYTHRETHTSIGKKSNF
jgi:hypothetical protein